MRAFNIRGSLKNYDWGKIGRNSAVAQLYKSAFSNFTVDEIPYAELWMGTHISGPALIPSLKDMPLIDWVKSNPDCLGRNIRNSFDVSKGLPFLFKVLSVNKALSIQVHPDKASAVKLHMEYPEYYPDDNHKPEMAIALTKFDALCGFRPLFEIKEFLLIIPQLKHLIGEEKCDDFTSSPTENKLKYIFTDLMTCTVDSFKSQLDQIVERFKQDSFNNSLCQSIQELFLKTVEQYPGDIGCFCLFFLNYLKLEPGEAIFLAANEPHAYLSGDCIECMACSDNVVRAGLTPKYKDVKTLCSMLTYKCKPGKENIFPYINDIKDPFLKIYNPPVKEFSIDSIHLPKTCDTYSLRAIDSASIIIVIEGTANFEVENEKGELYMGSVLFISSCFIINIKPKSDILLYRSYCSN